mmetsp:Transcript_132309/g.368828  ORF Transcript_132309/g.368828 Transcript_132309/m.368828 type:complete len:210 (-) Transcript_132309:697-1326(-)
MRTRRSELQGLYIVRLHPAQVNLSGAVLRSPSAPAHQSLSEGGPCGTVVTAARRLLAMREGPVHSCHCSERQQLHLPRAHLLDPAALAELACLQHGLQPGFWRGIQGQPRIWPDRALLRALPRLPLHPPVQLPHELLVVGEEFRDLLAQERGKRLLLVVVRLGVGINLLEHLLRQLAVLLALLLGGALLALDMLREVAEAALVALLAAL